MPAGIHRAGRLRLCQMGDRRFCLQLLFDAFHGGFEGFAIDGLEQITARLHLVAEHREIGAGRDEDDRAVVVLIAQQPRYVQSGGGMRQILVAEITVEQQQVVTAVLPAFDERFRVGENVTDRLHGIPAGGCADVPAVEVFRAHGGDQFAFGRVILDDGDAHVPSLLCRDCADDVPALLPSVPGEGNTGCRGACVSCHTADIDNEKDPLHTERVFFALRLDYLAERRITRPEPCPRPRWPRRAPCPEPQGIRSSRRTPCRCSRCRTDGRRTSCPWW